MTSDLAYKLRAWTAVLALCLMPGVAWSVEPFAQASYDGYWLLVVDSPTMSHRVYWHDLGADATYRFELAADENFSDVVLDVDGITTNYFAPEVDPGFYYIRVSVFDSFGSFVSSSEIGALEVVVDQEPPSLAILTPTQGDVFQKGEVMTIELEVSDDTVMEYARLTVGGDYAGVIELKAKDFKIFPSFGEPRIVTFDYEVPTSRALDVSVDLYDVMFNRATATVSINGGGTGSDSTTTGPGKGKGYAKGKKN